MLYKGKQTRQDRHKLHRFYSPEGFLYTPIDSRISPRLVRRNKNHRLSSVLVVVLETELSAVAGIVDLANFR